MAESVVDVLLHPVRLRIVRALSPDREATVAEIAEELPDVPPATLYRHITKLADAGIITVASEREVRGAIERRFRLARISLDDSSLADASSEDHVRYFMTFTAALIDDFAAYIESGKPNYAADGAGYRQFPLFLTDAEFHRLMASLYELIAPYEARRPSAKRKPRLLATIVMPAVRHRAKERE